MLGWIGAIDHYLPGRNDQNANANSRRRKTSRRRVSRLASHMQTHLSSCRSTGLSKGNHVLHCSRCAQFWRVLYHLWSVDRSAKHVKLYGHLFINWLAQSFGMLTVYFNLQKYTSSLPAVWQASTHGWSRTRLMWWRRAFKRNGWIDHQYIIIHSTALNVC